MNIVDIISRKLMHLRLQPIHVYCFHHVCEIFDAESMYEVDWMSIQVFKEKISQFQKNGVNFISMKDAYDMISNNFFRFRKYVVLSFDDGYSSLKEILPWLKEQSIPVTLFVNPDYADCKAFRESRKEKYLSLQELSDYDVEIGMHGIQHLDVSMMNCSELRSFVRKTLQNTSDIRGFIPFWAYTWGRHNDMSDMVLKENNLIPVLIDGMKNYNNNSAIHREELK